MGNMGKEEEEERWEKGGWEGKRGGVDRKCFIQK
jgi:hypothetical protein